MKKVTLEKDFFDAFTFILYSDETSYYKDKSQEALDLSKALSKKYKIIRKLTTDFQTAQAAKPEFIELNLNSEQIETLLLGIRAYKMFPELWFGTSASAKIEIEKRMLEIKSRLEEVAK